MVPSGGLGELFPEVINKGVDKPDLGFILPTIKVIEKHLLGQCGALAQTEELEDAVFLAGQARWLVLDPNDAAVEIDDKLAGPDHGVALWAAHLRLDACDKLTTLEGLDQKVVGAKTESLDLVIEFRDVREDQDRRRHPRGPQPSQHLVPVDVGER